ncbi:HAMP domain-containing protein [Vibrio sp. RE86]|uniref:methyl-accepting chemotaxis protein n=1 Tax=Vibrio sp. RE86 TaxID=2607605 RepID=UPI001493DA99|nr:methyl-accepting chemotaxis protein [Vibrio sp. RE86]NOH81018.1 HAMP domain-containing protein [Vibrio sp. RE86]
MKSITSKTLGVLIVIMLLIGATVSTVLYMTKQNSVEAGFLAYKSNLNKQMSVILQEPLYVYDADVSQAIINSFSDDKNITSITVVDQRNKKLAEMSKSQQSDESLTVDIEWEGKAIGKVIIELSHSESNQQLAQATRQAISSIALFVVLISAAVFFILQKLVLKPLSEVNSTLADIAGGGGDLTARINVKSSDEIGQLGTSFNSFIATVQDIVQDMAGAANQLKTVSGNVQSIKDQTIQNTSAQIELTDNSVHSMQELDRATQEIAGSTESAVHKAEHVRLVASQSHQAVNANIGSIETLVGNLEHTASEVSSLKQASDNIGSVLDVIKGIAEQTNLLALNAAIEAARAGDSGRGFAVVADEVRALASKTHASTEEIENIIQKLQMQAEASYRATQESKAMVAQTIDSAAETGNALEQINSEIDAMNDMIVTISSACEEQSTISSMVRDDMDKLSSGSTQLTKNNEILDRETSHLLQLGNQLVTQVQKFKY